MRPITTAFGVALVLAPRPTEASLARLDIALERTAHCATHMVNPELETLRLNNPSARCLPVLAALARESAQELILDYLPESQLLVTSRPMSDDASARLAAGYGILDNATQR